jgi:hypothetical protein
LIPGITILELAMQLQRDLKNPDVETVAVLILLGGTILWTYVFLPLVFYHH